MISKEDLVRNVAETCGISLENSTLFFDVFINRVSNKLKPGEIINFNNYGFFQKRQCRIQLEKTPSSPAAKSYVIHLVIFSLEPKVESDLTAVQFLRIPNLKTLWLDDEDFLKSLNAGDFAPYTERNQLIKAFATKAEVILANQRKDYDSESESELIIPLTFDLNFLIRSGHKQSTPDKKENLQLPVNKDKVTDDDKIIKEKIDDGLSAERLNDNSKVGELNKMTAGSVNKSGKDELKDKFRFVDSAMKRKSQEELKKGITVNDKSPGPSDFEPVTARLSNAIDDKKSQLDYNTVKFSLGNKPDSVPEEQSSNKFTAVKTKTEAYKLKGDTNKGKQKSGRSVNNGYDVRKNYLPLIIITTFIIISLAAIYFYFIKSDKTATGSPNLSYGVKPPSDTNVIERDYEYAVTLPYSKSKTPVQVEGYDKKIFVAVNQKSTLSNEKKSKEKIGITEVTPKDKTNKKEVAVEEKLKIELQQQNKTKPETKNETKVTEQQSSRIFLYKGFYVVYVGSFKTEDEVDREADKYSNLGYNPVIETVESNERGRPRVYKLNVGDFTSEEFAKQFEAKYLK